MTKDDEVINHLHCAWNKKEQGYTDEATDEILKALCVLLERDIPRAGERIKRSCLVGKSCKKCLIEDGGCKECSSETFSDDETELVFGLAHDIIKRTCKELDCEPDECKECSITKVLEKLKRRGK